jgi:hypothetical protein
MKSDFEISLRLKIIEKYCFSDSRRNCLIYIVIEINTKIIIYSMFVCAFNIHFISPPLHIAKILLHAFTENQHIRVQHLQHLLWIYISAEQKRY